MISKNYFKKNCNELSKDKAGFKKEYQFTTDEGLWTSLFTEYIFNK